MRIPGRYTERGQIHDKIDRVRAAIRKLRDEVTGIFSQIKDAEKMRNAFSNANQMEEAQTYQNQIDVLRDKADKLGKLASYREDILLKQLGEKLSEFDTVKMPFMDDASGAVKLNKTKA